MIRSFIALDLPKEIKATLNDLISELKSELSGIKWVKTDGLHLTLKFLGDINEAQLPSIKNVLEQVCQQMASFELEGTGIGVFPDIKRARVIWVGIKGAIELLTKLQASIEEGLLSYGFAKEKRGFKPHLTLGRIKRPLNPQRLLKSIERHQKFTTATFKINEVVLYKSELHPQGAIYTPLQKVALKK